MVPSTLTAGDFVTWTETAFDARGPGGYRLEYELRGPVPLSITAAELDGQWSVTLTPAVTATLPAGLYGWSAVLTDKTDSTRRHTVSTGALRVAPNLATISGKYDPRSQAQKAVDDLRAALADFGEGSGSVRSYTIGDRAMTFDSKAELLKILAYWEAELARETAAAAGNPAAASGRYYVRFGKF